MKPIPQLFPKGITAKQQEGIDTLVVTFAGYDVRYIAYVLATVYWECDQTMQPIEERGRGAGYTYGKPAANGIIYYGRGYVQLTWLGNYQAATEAAKHFGHDWDFVNHPELCLQEIPAAWVCKWGMLNGSFTGKKLSDYFNDKISDPIGARKIINGTDMAAKIAGFYNLFLNALQ